MSIDREQLKRIISTPSGPHPILQILEVFNSNPKSSVPIQTLLEYFRNTNQHEIGSIFADIYETLSDDIEYDVFGSDIERSIISFYLKNPSAKSNGLKVCDKLSLSPGLDNHRKTMCRNNLLWYANPLSDYAAVDFVELQLDNKDGYTCLNPSIAVWNDELWAIQRTVNYELNSDGHYIPVVDDNIRTRNWLCKLDKNYKIIQAYVINQPVDWPSPLYGAVLGFEDSRLFVHNNELWTSSTVRELEEGGRAQIVVARLNFSSQDTVEYADWHAIQPTWSKQKYYEKNWMPVADSKDKLWVYSSDPLRVINEKGETVHYTTHALSAEHWRGGGQAVAFKGGYLYCIHETIIPNYKDRTYLHRLVWCDSDWNVKKISAPFYLMDRGIEFVSGMANFKDNIIFSFGWKDKKSYLANIPHDDVWNMLTEVNQPAKTIVKQAEHIVKRDTGTALLNWSQVVECRNILGKAGLPMHLDTPKNWDNLIALYMCLQNCKTSEAVLDVGATQDSAFLPTLYRCGYTDLVSLNLSKKEDELINGVLYRNGDITATDYEPEHFGFVSCLSVIEHGIDQNKFFKEVYRITKAKGLVVISTDYWSKPVDTKDKTMFDTDMVIFTPKDINQMIAIAEQNGFACVNKFDPTTSDALIHNLGVQYTFATLVFEKR